MAFEIDTQILDLLEVVVDDLLTVFDVNSPPVPVEIMLQRPKTGMWQQVNLGEMSTTFLRVSEQYGLRLSIARLLARHICRSVWGEAHGLTAYSKNDTVIYALARALLIPRRLIVDQKAPHDSIAVSYRFGVPESAARLRLMELNLALST